MVVINSMRKLLLSIVLILFTISGFCQELQPVKLDNEVTVSLFPGYQRKDTSKESIYSVNGLFGYMIAIREANAKNNTPLKNAGGLNKELKTYIKGIQAEVDNSSAQNVRDTTIGTLKAKVFTLKSGGDQSEPTYRNFLLLYTKDATYTFEYVFPETRSGIVKNEYKSFISSIKTAPDLNWNDQYLSQSTGMSSTTQIGLFGGGGVLLIIMIVVAARRKKPALG
jgi:hypothetical protein